MSARKQNLDMNNLPKALSPTEAAAVIGLTLASYYRYVHPAVVRGDILSMLIGRQRRIITSSLLAWLERQALDEREAWHQ